MSERIAGKTFTNREELGLPPASDEEIADAKAQFAAFNREADARRAAGTADHIEEPSRRFWDDTTGTEYEDRSAGPR
ncbi:hypothetical protein NBRGN_067_00330 [Nocardia brasiliensis NBRC 14402]|uniref:hypothetical protein n=1 Tax=Nocardia brasiliensis TaxID=37326 RepID=UPI0002D55E59|nr:hypothetical protein [Nocardia brasiliensis]ASF09116.1 hypothetical protein CEQ30_19025 [Nocardia brasiliensis]GAJ83944.1 hypothetical protein NBRGN_067_00330 [Nocardia brasiliensis NBRC 14402]SUB40255.1 Uncharacterised protein [Nocardia brasiliensis]